MSDYEYKIVAAPIESVTFLKFAKMQSATTADTNEIVNLYASRGWEFVRSDYVTTEETKRFLGRSRGKKPVLVFRRSADYVESDEDRLRFAMSEPTPTLEVVVDNGAPAAEPANNVTEIRPLRPTANTISRRPRPTLVDLSQSSAAN